MGKGRVHVKFFRVLTNECPHCHGNGKISVEWDSEKIDLVNKDRE